MADIQELEPIKTAHGVLEVYRNWDYEGAIGMKNPKTIKRYEELRSKHPDCSEYGIFFAFNDKQYEEGKAKMKELGFYKDGQKIYSFVAGGYGTSKELIDKFFNFYKEQDKIIAKECDPQEVYLYEYNNHECFLSWDGDDAAYDKVVHIFGKEVAETIKRLN